MAKFNQYITVLVSSFMSRKFLNGFSINFIFAIEVPNKILIYSRGIFGIVFSSISSDLCTCSGLNLFTPLTGIRVLIDVYVLFAHTSKYHLTIVHRLNITYTVCNNLQFLKLQPYLPSAECFKRFFYSFQFEKAIICEIY